MTWGGASLGTEGFGVARGNRVVLASVDLTVPERGAVALLGPVAAGKSTLLSALAGHLQADASCTTWGTAVYAGVPLGEPGARRPALVRQHARLLVANLRDNLMAVVGPSRCMGSLEKTRWATSLLEGHGMADLVPHLQDHVALLPLVQQRMVAVLREVAADPALLMVDEATHGLGPQEAARLLDLLAQVACDRAVLMATHNQTHAQRLADQVVLLAGGRVQESGPAASFFREPATPAGQQFVRTGSCAVPSPTASPDELAEGVPPPPPLPVAAAEAQARPAARVPSGFVWMRRGLLAGLARPGLMAPLDEDLEGLAALGVKVLVTLEETATVPMAALRAHGLDGWHAPVPDMHAPDVAHARRWVAAVEKMNRAGVCVAYHCKAGLGRTGTLLAAHLVVAGSSAVAALEAARRVNNLFVQSDAQVRFLWALECAVAAEPGGATDPIHPAAGGERA